MATQNINQRLDEFAETHSAVLLGMHKELSALKEHVEARLQEHSTSQSKMLHKSNGVFNHMSQLQKDIEKQQKEIACYVENDVKRWVKDQREATERERQAVMQLLSDIKRKFSLHQQQVDSFNKTTRRLALASLLVFLGIAVWIGVHQ